MQLRILMLLLAVLTPGLARAQLTYAYDSYVVGRTTNYIATVTNYTGGGAVTIPSGLFHGLYFYHVTAIGDSAFEGTAITSVTIPDTVTSIGNHAFYYCPGLTSVTIGNGVTSIGVYAFTECSSLTGITVSAGNPAYSSLNGVLFNKTQTALLQFPTAFGGSYTIPDGVTNIFDYAFEWSSSLTNVTIPASVTSIGEFAFADCHTLTSITFFGDAPATGFAAFARVGNMVIYYAPGTSGWNPYESWPNTVQLSFFNGFGFTFNNGAITITNYTGSGGNVTIPAVFYGYPVTAIAAGAFANNNALTGIVIPNSVTNIGVQAFQNDIYLTSVTLSTNLTSIGIQAFAGDVSLTSLTIPASVNALGVQAFYNDVSLTNVTFLGDAPSLGNGTFGGDYATIYYYYGTHGWTNPFGGLTAVMLGAPNPPQIGGNAGVISGNFGFTITGVASQTIIVEASTNLTSWSPVWTNTLTGMATNFTDPQWKNFPARFYRAR